MDGARDEALRRVAGLDDLSRRLLRLHRDNLRRRAAFLQEEVSRELGELAGLARELDELDDGAC